MKVLVTGGGGFLGRRIVELLLERGHAVRFLARGRYPEVEALGAEGVQADLQEPAAVRAACAGMDAVVHAASLAGFWGPIATYRGINVDGTQNVIDACLAAGVRQLVYTSTPSVIGYAHEVEGLGEAPYPQRWESPYGATKAEAEQRVLAANGASGPHGALATVALRPHLIIGPRDNHLLPTVVARARQGRLMIVGDGKNRVDLTYVDNAAYAHLDALGALTGPDAPCAGKAYFISNDEPVVLWDWVNEVLPQLGVPALTRRIGFGAAQRLGGVLEWVHLTFGLRGEPRMTPFLAAALARSHWYDMGPAKRDLGYSVRVGMDEATRATVAWMRSAG